MLLSRDDILKRVEDLQQQRDKAIATLNAIIGALEDCQFWLNHFDAPVIKPDVTVPVVVDRTS